MNLNAFFLTAVLSVVLTACGKSGRDNAPEPQRGYVTGTVSDTRGEPIEGALVYIDNTGPLMSGASGHTDSKGKYRIKMAAGTYRVYAVFEKKYAGKTYTIQLKPSNPDSFSDDDSPVVDFRWVLSGQEPPPLVGYFGGYIGLYQGETNIPKNEVEFTFSPLELIDGSAGKPVVRKATQVSTQYLEDIPLGKYRVGAVHKPAGGGAARAIRLKNRDTKETSAETGTISLEFEPESAGSYRGNIEYYEP
ncbi:hypothetical protein GCM10027299_04520 [Larkinella ripae]